MPSLKRVRHKTGNAKEGDADVERAAPREEPWVPPLHGRCAYATKTQLIFLVPALVILGFGGASFGLVIHPRAGQPHLAQPVRLSSQFHMPLLVFNFVGILLNCVICHAMQHARQVALGFQKHFKHLPPSHGRWDKAAKTITIWDMGLVLVNTILLVLAVCLGLAMVNIAARSLIIIIILIAVLLPILTVALRALVVMVIRREREQTVAHVSRFSQRAAVVFAIQILVLSNYAACAYNTPLLFETQARGLPKLAQCENDVNASYVANYCTGSAVHYFEASSVLLTEDQASNRAEVASIANVRYPKAHASGGLVCQEDSVDGYRSLYDACELILPYNLFSRVAVEGLFASLTSTSILGVTELILGMDATVGPISVFTRARVPLRIAALLTLYQLWYTCILLLDMLTLFLGDLGGENFTVYGAAPLPVILAMLVIDFLVSKFKAAEDARPETSAEKEERVRFEAKRAKEMRTGKCSFWFVKAEYVRSWRPKSGAMSLPRFQELQSEGCLVQRTISLADACNAKLLQEHLAVSHRWLGDKADSPPDESGQQLSEIQAYLNKPENIGVKYVWYDYWSMPQGRDRTSAQAAEFKWMLENVNVVYLGCSVLILLDLSYLSRFW